MASNHDTPHELVPLLACPDCGGDMRGGDMNEQDAVSGGAVRPHGREKNGTGPRLGPHEREGQLQCSGCGAYFTVRNGIPILFPKKVDRKHLEEEDRLGAVMKRPHPSGTELFSEDQWRESKKDFWGFVKRELGSEPIRTVINIGCGIDKHFLELQELGHTVVAFDMIFHLLDTLRENHGSRYSVAGTVIALPFKTNSFDALCCIDLIHHEYAAIPRILDSFRSILKPGGYLFLEDTNAWGLYQFPKSIFLPKRLHGALRSFYHRFKRSSHRPADYEFPTSVWRTRKIIAKLGFEDITVVPQRTYPNVCPVGYKLYTILACSDYVRRFHNFHYMIYARKV